MNETKYLIYALRDPRDGKAYYVGASERGMARPRIHKCRSVIEHTKKENPGRAAWLESLPERHGLPYDVEILRAFKSRDDLWRKEDGEYPEENEIRKLRAAGEPLLNIAPGGPNTVTMVPWHRRARGGRHGFALHPESAASGKRNGAYTCPERVRKGETNGRAKMTDEIVREVRRMAADGESYSALGRRYRVSHIAVRLAVLRKTWRHIV